MVTSPMSFKVRHSLIFLDSDSTEGLWEYKENTKTNFSKFHVVAIKFSSAYDFVLRQSE
jgi:hypothetical protein